MRVLYAVSPRFSLRALTIAVTLICLYFGAWQFTKTSAHQVVFEEEWGRSIAGCPAPFLVAVFEPISLTPPPDSVLARIPREYHAGAGISWRPSPRVRYHVLLFGRLIPTSMIRRARGFYSEAGNVITLKRIVIAESVDEPALGSRIGLTGHE